MGNGRAGSRWCRARAARAVRDPGGARARRLRALLAAALALAGALVLLLHWRHGGGDGGARDVAGPAARAAPRGTSWLRAGALYTPGALNPAVTPATLGATICRRGWTRTVRPPVSYTGRLKQVQIAAWHLPGAARDYQEDHLISLELGGHPSDPRNLWPEPHPYAEQVDRLENELNRLVCSGRMSLAEAQLREARQKHERGRRRVRARGCSSGRTWRRRVGPRLPAERRGGGSRRPAVSGSGRRCGRATGRTATAPP